MTHVEHFLECWLISRPSPDSAPSEEMATPAAFMATATYAVKGAVRMGRAGGRQMVGWKGR